jgi:hypothetical protein
MLFYIAKDEGSGYGIYASTWSMLWDTKAWISSRVRPPHLEAQLLLTCPYTRTVQQVRCTISASESPKHIPGQEERENKLCSCCISLGVPHTIFST